MSTQTLNSCILEISLLCNVTFSMDALYESLLFYFCCIFISFGAPPLFCLDTVASGKKKNNLLAQMEVRK